jgi:type I restriction enzyme S subunit
MGRIRSAVASLREPLFLQYFERIAEEPNAVPRLRRFILDLAVRGKLVEQKPMDEPASELLKRIEKQKARLIKEGRIRNQKPLPPIEVDSVPFEIPKFWAWVRLGSIGDWGSGSTPPRGSSEYYGGGITWLKSGELEDKLDLRCSEETVTESAIEKCSFRLNKAGDVLIAMYDATIGKLAILAEAAVTNQAVCGCTPLDGILNRYLFVFLLSQREYFHSQSEGGAQPNISKVKIVNFGFPLPPLAEQHRIVAKVDKLMALCDELEAAQQKRERRRDRLVVASLHGLNNGTDGEEFRQNARFYFNHLPRRTYPTTPTDNPQPRSAGEARGAGSQRWARL